MSILKFNVILLESKTKQDPTYLVEALRLWYTRKDSIYVDTKNKFKPLGVSLHGSGYLLNPDKLFNSKVDILFKAQYIKLAGRRDYSSYTLLGINYLDLTYFSDLNIEAVKSNPLLKIENNKIYFKLEE